MPNGAAQAAALCSPGIVDPSQLLKDMRPAVKQSQAPWTAPTHCSILQVCHGWGGWHGSRRVQRERALAEKAGGLEGGRHDRLTPGRVLSQLAGAAQSGCSMTGLVYQLSGFHSGEGNTTAVELSMSAHAAGSWAATLAHAAVAVD